MSSYLSTQFTFTADHTSLSNVYIIELLTNARHSLRRTQQQQSQLNLIRHNRHSIVVNSVRSYPL